MKRLFSVFLILAMLLACSSCSESGTGRTILYAISASPSTLDPQFASESGAKIIINNVFEGLVRYNSEGEIIPGIAESWSVSDDGLVYSFNLKPNTEWFCPSTLKSELGDELYKHFSSETVKARDFVFAMQRAVDPSTASPNAHRLSVIEKASDIIAGRELVSSLGVKATSDYSLEIRLSEKCDDFLSRLTESVCMPCNEDFFKAMAGRYGLSNKYIMCNGPFYISSWDRETSLTIKKNSYYAGEQEVLPVSVAFSYDSSNKSVAEKLGKGDVSAAFISSDTVLPENVKIAKESPNTVMVLAFNCTDKYLKNSALRQALSHAIDPSVFASGEFKMQQGIVPECCRIGDYNYRSAVGTQTKQLAYNVSEAQKLWETALAELEASKISLNILCPAEFETPMRYQLQLWQQNFGIDLVVTVETAEPEDIEKSVASGNYQIALTGIDASSENTIDFLSQFDKGGFFRYSSDNYSRIISNLYSSSDSNAILEGCFAAETLLLQEAVCYPLYARSSYFALASDAADISLIDSESTVSFINAKRFD